MIETGATSADRRRWMGVLAKSSPAELEAEIDALPQAPRYRLARRPDVGLTLVRGRIGGTGAPFNLGEMTMTRCVVELVDDAVLGFSFVAGRDERHAERAALLDALLQVSPKQLTPAIERLAARQAERRAARQAAVEPSKVEFFTLVRE